MIIVALAVSIIVNIRMTLVPELELVEPSIGSPGRFSGFTIIAMPS